MCLSGGVPWLSSGHGCGVVAGAMGSRVDRGVRRRWVEVQSRRALAWRCGCDRFLPQARRCAWRKARFDEHWTISDTPTFRSSLRRPTTMSLFGNTQNTTQQQGSSLFGNTTNQQQTGTSSLFGGQQQQQQQPQNTSSLFGAPSTQQQNTISHQPGTNVSGSAPNQFSTFPTGTNTNQPASQTTALNPLAASGAQDLAAQTLGARGIHNQRNEKRTFEQVQTLVRKWDPHSQDTVLQSYLYNAVSSAYAPFYYRNVDEGEHEWEEALRNKPLPVKGDGGEEVSFVPVLVRGFRALGERVEFQARTVNEMRARLHEMNNRYACPHHSIDHRSTLTSYSPQPQRHHV